MKRIRFEHRRLRVGSPKSGVTGIPPRLPSISNGLIEARNSTAAMVSGVSPDTPTRSGGMGYLRWEVAE